MAKKNPLLRILFLLTLMFAISGCLTQAQAVANVSFSIDPAAKQVNVGDIFTMAIKVDASSNTVDGAQVFINFNSTYLRVVDSTGIETNKIEDGELKSTIWPDLLKNVVDNTTGQIDYSAGKGTTGSSATTLFTLATIRYKVIAEIPAGGTDITFVTVTPLKTKAQSGITAVTGQLTGANVQILPSEIILSVNPNPVNLSVGGRQALTPTVNPADAEVAYESADTDVATVDESGVITAISVGSTDITVGASKEGFDPASVVVPVTVKSGGGGGGGGGISVSKPYISTYTPGKDAVDMGLDAVVSATFNMDIAGVNLTGVFIKDAAGNKVDGVNSSLDDRKLLIAHNNFAYNTKYTVTIPKNTVKDKNSSGYNDEASWSFTTVKETVVEIPVKPVGPVVPVDPCAFLDVPDTYWASGFISDLCQKGITSGYPDKTIKPDNNISRAEFVTLLAKALKLSGEGPTTSVYADVMSGDWYYSAVSEAEKAGLVSGYENGEFRPGAPITREEMAVVLVRAIGKKAEAEDRASEATSFSDDAEISTWARGSVSVAVAEGLIKGYPDGSFGPTRNATRAEAFSIISPHTDLVIKSTGEGASPLLLPNPSD